MNVSNFLCDKKYLYFVKQLVIYKDFDVQFIIKIIDI